MSDFNNEDEDFIIPPFLFRNDEEIDGISDNDSPPRYRHIPSIISLNSSFNTDSDFSNTSQSTMSSPESSGISNDFLFESLINMRPPLVDGEIPSSFIEMRNNVINTQLNEGNIRLHSSVISDLGGTRENDSPVSDLPYFYIGGIKVQWNRSRRTSRASYSRRIFDSDSDTPEFSRRLGTRTTRSVRFLESPTRSASQSWQRPGSSRRNIQYPLSRGDNPAHRASGDRPSSWDTIPTQLSNLDISDPLSQGPDIIETGNETGPNRNLHLGRLNWIEDNVEDIFAYLISVEPPSSPESTPAPSNSLQNVAESYNQINSDINEPCVLNVEPQEEETLPDDLTSFIADILTDLISMTLDNVSSDAGPTEPTE